MTNTSKHTEAKLLSGYIYHNGSIKCPQGYRVLEKSQNAQNGFYTEALYKNEKIVIVYRGTDTEKGIINSGFDIGNDLTMLARVSPTQAQDARRFRNEIKKKYPKYLISLTGHSLGGSLAQIVGSETGDETVTFSAFGTKKIQGANAKYTNNITNYGNPQDWVFTSNINNQIGKTQLTKVGNKHLQPQDIKLKEKNKTYHTIEHMGNIDDTIAYRQPKSLLAKLDDERKKKLQAFSERLAESPEKVQQRKAKHVSLEALKSHQNKRIQHVHDMVQNAHKRKSQKQVSQSSGPIFVEGYTRSDGVQVKSYYRTA